MADSNSTSRDRWRWQGLQGNSGRDIQYLLRGEEQLLQAISARAPLAEVLHKICDALDSEIGNMMSVIALLNDDAAGLEAIAKSASLFGLHKFCSANVVGGNDESLGYLEMYCSVPRRPFLHQVQFIVRATCPAAAAVKCPNE